MKNRFRLFKRGKVYYAEDTTDGKQTSLRTRSKAEADQLLAAKNESVRQPQLNLQIARAYLSAHDPALIDRQWRDAMALMSSRGKEASQTRLKRAMKSEAFGLIRDLKIFETTAEHFFAILED